VKGRLLPGVGLLLVLVALMAGSSIAQWPEMQTSDSSQRMLSQAARPAFTSHAGGTDIVTAAPREDNLREKRVLGHYMTWYKTPKTYGGPGCFNPEARGEWRMWNLCGHDPNTITGTHGFRDIAAVHYPLIGPYDSADSKIIEYHLLQALAAGVDTFVVDYYGKDDSGGIDEASLRVLRQVEEMNTRYATNFKIALMYDEGALTAISPTLRLGKAISDFDHMLQTYATSPAYLWADGKPAMFYFHKGPILSPTQLAAVATGFSLVYIDFLPDYLPVMNGSYAWVKADPSWMPDGSNWGEPYLKWYYPELDYRSTSVPTLTFGVGGVWAGFDDVGVGREWSCNDRRWIDRQGGQVYSRTWDILNTYNDAMGITYTLPVSWVQLITLNDYMEGTTLFASVAITGKDGQDYGYGYGYQYVQQTETHATEFKGLPDDDKLDIYVAQHIYNARLVSGTISNTALLDNALNAFHSGHYTMAMALADKAAGIPAPINVTAIRAGGALIVSWQDQPGATLASGHRISYGLEPGKYISSTVVPTGSSAMIGGLIPDATYYVAITTLGTSNPCETWYVSESWYADEVIVPPKPYVIYLSTVLKDE
jgi:hypothetical protein